MWATIFLLLALKGFDTSPAIRLTVSQSVISQGESYIATFSGKDVTNDMSFDVSYRGPNDVRDKYVHWQDGAVQIQRVKDDLMPGTWRITGVRMHRKDMPYPFLNEEDFQPLDIAVTVRWPMTEKVLLWLAILFELFVVSRARRWFRETK